MKILILHINFTQKKTQPGCFDTIKNMSQIILELIT